MNEPGLVFLLLNASVVWAVIAGLLTWLMRSKLFVMVVMIAPYVPGARPRRYAAQITFRAICACRG